MTNHWHWNIDHIQTEGGAGEGKKTKTEVLGPLVTVGYSRFVISIINLNTIVAS